MPAYTHLIWDFNGTILNDLDASLLAANALLEQYGLKTLRSIEQYKELFGFPVIEYYKRMGFDFDKLSYDQLAVEWVAYYRRFSADASVFPEIPRLLREVRELGGEQIILSASELGLLTSQLRGLGIYDCFSEVLGLDNIHANSKTQLAHAWRAAHPNAKALFIGDTEHDADTARAMEADCILVASGHRPFHALQKTDAIEVLTSLAELDMHRYFS
jgi:phosphoglycolate phosphatase